MRRTIHAAAPRAEECIRYPLPAFQQDGLLVAFGASAKHCALYPGSSKTVAAHARELAAYDTSKGTIRFLPDAPLPVALVRKLVRARLAENAARRKSSSEAVRKRRSSATPTPRRTRPGRGRES